MEKIEKPKPEKKFRAGALSATIWSNQGRTRTGEETTYATVSIERNYKDKQGNWQSTNSFRTGDLPKAALLLNKAYEYLTLKSSDA